MSKLASMLMSEAAKTLEDTVLEKISGLENPDEKKYFDDVLKRAKNVFSYSSRELNPYIFVNHYLSRLYGNNAGSGILGKSGGGENIQGEDNPDTEDDDTTVEYNAGRMGEESFSSIKNIIEDKLEAFRHFYDFASTNRVESIRVFSLSKDKSKDFSESLDQLDKFYKKFQENSERLISLRSAESATLLLECDETTSWYDLNTNECSAESTAMKHCGRDSYGDTLWSLREKVYDESGNLSGYLPRITATYRERDDSIIQIKGFKNQKVSPKYWKYFIMLAKSGKFSALNFSTSYKPWLDIFWSDFSESELREMYSKNKKLANDPLFAALIGKKKDQWVSSLDDMREYHFDGNGKLDLYSIKKGGVRYEVGMQSKLVQKAVKFSSGSKIEQEIYFKDLHPMKRTEGGEEESTLDSNLEKMTKYAHREDKPAFICYFPDGKLEKEAWYYEGKLHRTDDLPAHTLYHENGEVKQLMWYVNGDRHRDGNPAYLSYFEDGTLEASSYCKQNLTHAVGFPAYLHYWENGNLRRKVYWYEGQIFRMGETSEPAAYIYFENGNEWCLGWYEKMDELHKEDGPAKIIKDESGNITSKLYYIDGNQISKEEFLREHEDKDEYVEGNENSGKGEVKEQPKKTAKKTPVRKKKAAEEE